MSIVRGMELRAETSGKVSKMTYASHNDRTKSTIGATTAPRISGSTL